MTWLILPLALAGIGQATRRTLTCAVVPLRSSCRRLRVTPRDVADDVARAFGGEEVRLELEAYDRRAAGPVTVDVNEDVLLLWAVCCRRSRCWCCSMPPSRLGAGSPA